MSDEEGIGHTVGIDLGTTRTAVAHVTNGEPEIVENAEGNDLTPSIVHVTEEGNAIVGDSAEDQLVMHPDRTVAEIKRQIGEDIDVQLGRRSYRPDEISALILEKVVGDVADRFGGRVDSAVITVPAYFTGRQRTATRNAGELAGLEVEHLLPEPSAAVLAYGYEQQKLGDSADETIFAYDLGGGTFDATIVEAEYEHNYVETVLTDGDSDLGGADWTKAIEKWIVSGIEEDTRVEIGSDSEYADQRKRIRKAAEEAKHKLSRSRETVVTIPFVIPEQSYSFERRLDRETFEELTESLLERTRQTVNDVLTSAGYRRQEIDTVLLVGGASRMPQVEKLLESYFGQPPSKRVSPDRAVAIGAAVQASIVSTDVTEIPSFLSGTDEDEEGNSGEHSSAGGLVLVDVLPQTLGVELINDEFSPIIENGSQLPTTVRKETFRTVDPDQTAVEWPIRQGELPRASNNDLLGTLVIQDIPPRDPEEDSIAIEFTMNSDGTLEVEIEDLITGKTVDGTIESGIRLSPEQIDRMADQLPRVE